MSLRKGPFMNFAFPQRTLNSACNQFLAHEDKRENNGHGRGSPLQPKTADEIDDGHLYVNAQGNGRIKWQQSSINSINPSIIPARIRERSCWSDIQTFLFHSICPYFRSCRPATTAWCYIRKSNLKPIDLDSILISILTCSLYDV